MNKALELLQNVRIAVENALDIHGQNDSATIEINNALLTLEEYVHEQILDKEIDEAVRGVTQ